VGHPVSSWPFLNPQLKTNLCTIALQTASHLSNAMEMVRNALKHQKYNKKKKM
jgi:hypothetical protein